MNSSVHTGCTLPLTTKVSASSIRTVTVGLGIAPMSAIQCIASEQLAD